MKNARIGVAAVAVALLSGCATIVEGGKQSVYFTTDPDGATCSIMREGQMLFHDVKTPATLELEKDKDELVITCEKDGYKKKVVHTDSTFQGWTLGNILFGGIVGIGIDAASGAMNEYPSQVSIPLQKEE